MNIFKLRNVALPWKSGGFNDLKVKGRQYAKKPPYLFPLYEGFLLCEGRGEETNFFLFPLYEGFLLCEGKGEEINFFLFPLYEGFLLCEGRGEETNFFL